MRSRKPAPPAACERCRCMRSSASRSTAPSVRKRSIRNAAMDPSQRTLRCCALTHCSALWVGLDERCAAILWIGTCEPQVHLARADVHWSGVVHLHVQLFVPPAPLSSGARFKRQCVAVKTMSRRNCTWPMHSGNATQRPPSNRPHCEHACATVDNCYGPRTSKETGSFAQFEKKIMCSPALPGPIRSDDVMFLPLQTERQTLAPTSGTAEQPQQAQYLLASCPWTGSGTTRSVSFLVLQMQPSPA